MDVVNAMHVYWRGSLRYHARIVASGFHSGRVMITWEPNVDSTLIAPLNKLANRIQMVVDLQETTDVYFSIPWMTPAPWLLTRATLNLPRTANGTLSFTVINTLATPSGEPTTVDVVMWMYGTSDLEFALPYITNPATATVRELVLEEQVELAPLSDSKYANMAGSYSLPGKMCMGEKITSVNQACSKHTIHSQVTASTSSFSRTWYATAGTAAPSPNCHMSVWSNMFVFSRGTVKYAFTAYEQPSNMPVNELRIGINQDTTNPQYPQLGFFVSRREQANTMIEVPYYARFLFYYGASTGLSELFDNVPSAWSQVYGSAATSFAYTTWMAPGRDFHFAYIICPPTSIL
jgi:hypothetical protein